jgi:hypothetical protein
MYVTNAWFPFFFVVSTHCYHRGQSHTVWTWAWRRMAFLLIAHLTSCIFKLRKAYSAWLYVNDGVSLLCTMGRTFAWAPSLTGLKSVGGCHDEMWK